jgi:hypothetical protein
MTKIYNFMKFWTGSMNQSQKHNINKILWIDSKLLFLNNKPEKNIFDYFNLFIF